MLRLPGAGRTGGGGEPDLAVRNAPVPSSPTRTGWWIYEVKPASQAGPTGMTYRNAKTGALTTYNGSAALAQIQRYISAMQTAYPGQSVVRGRPITPQSAVFPGDGTIETIFSANEWGTYGTNFETPVNSAMDGIIFYTNFKLTKNKQPSKQFPKALPAIQLLISETGSQLSVNDFLQQLIATGSLPTAACQAPSAPAGNGHSYWPWIVGGTVGLGAAGYAGVNAFRPPSWLSDKSISEFLDSQGVPIDEYATSAASLAEAGESAGLLADADEAVEFIELAAIL
jgi:hypothetical protein